MLCQSFFCSFSSLSISISRLAGSKCKLWCHTSSLEPLSPLSLNWPCLCVVLSFSFSFFLYSVFAANLSDSTWRILGNVHTEGAKCCWCCNVRCLSSILFALSVLLFCLSVSLCLAIYCQTSWQTHTHTIVNEKTVQQLRKKKNSSLHLRMRQPSSSSSNHTLCAFHFPLLADWLNKRRLRRRPREWMACICALLCKHNSESEQASEKCVRHDSAEDVVVVWLCFLLALQLESSGDVFLPAVLPVCQPFGLSLGLFWLSSQK